MPDRRTSSTTTAGAAFTELELERHRPSLTAFCRQRLGSAFEAEDAVQETMLRAWRAADRFESRSTVRTWLYRIATNVCLDMLRRPQRRAQAFDFEPAAPDARTERAVEGGDDPADVVVARESLRHAVEALLRNLPPRQRAVLVLRDVLCWPAADVAELLGTTTASVNSALQRAHAAAGAVGAGRASRPADPHDPRDSDHGAMVARFLDAFERSDFGGLLASLGEDGKGRRRVAA